VTTLHPSPLSHPATTPRGYANARGNGVRVGFPYVDRHHRDSGRYVCLGSPATRAPLTSRFDLAQGIRALFGPAFTRAVSGYSISVDTSSSGNQGRSSALIKRIRFLR
jgi:hypothetical protein